MMKYINTLIFLIMLFSLLLVSSINYTLEQPPSIKAGYEWVYDITFYNKTSGESNHYTSIITVESVSSNNAIVKAELLDDNNQTVIIMYTVIDASWRVTNITYVYPDVDYTIENIYTSNDKPLFMVYPSNVNEEYTINALSDTYLNNEYYYSTKEIYYISVPRIDKIIYKNHVIPSYVVTIIHELRDPDTNYLYNRINTTYWINKDFIHPFLILEEDEETKMTYVLKYYKLDYEPLNNYPIVSQKVSVNIKAELTGNYTSSPPNAKITISRNGEIIGEYSISDLPVSLSLDTGDYTFTITPTQGKTVDQEGLFKFLKWSINGVEQEGETITISISSNTSITVFFYVYTLPVQTTTTTTTVPITTTTLTTITGATTTSQQTTSRPPTLTSTSTTQQQGKETTTTHEWGRTTTPSMNNNNGGNTAQTMYNMPTTNPYIPSENKGDNTLYIAIGAVGIAGAGAATYFFFRRRRPGIQTVINKPYQPPYQPPPPSTTNIQYQQQALPASITTGTIGVEKAKPKLKKCPYCGSLIPLKAKYCPKCGNKLPPLSPESSDKKYKICPSCGAQIPAKAKFCPKCGSKLP